MHKRKAIGIFSGGLDSWLAALLIREQGFMVYLLHFVSPYFGYGEQRIEEIRARVKEEGMELIVHKFGQEYLDDVIREPRHGMGSAINACIDCHRLMLQVAKEKMLELGAEFVFSGEVLGQRPMSQRKEALNIVEKESGLRGYLVRPLSARLLRPTEPEKNGILDRDLLMDISGRGRKRQVQLAERFNLRNYPQPAGGCKFTDPNMTKRFKSISRSRGSLSWEYLELLKFGRHFDMGNDLHFVTARDEKEVGMIYSYSRLGVLIEPKTSPGSTGLLLDYSPEHDPLSHNEAMTKAGRIIARYSKGYQVGAGTVDIVYMRDGRVLREEALEPLLESELRSLML